MAKCERCGNDRVPVAEYTLQKRGSTRQVVLCKPCRDVTAQVYALEAVDPEPVAVAAPEGPESEGESETLEVEEETPEAEGETEPTPRRRRRSHGISSSG